MTSLSQYVEDLVLRNKRDTIGNDDGYVPPSPCPKDVNDSTAMLMMHSASTTDDERGLMTRVCQVNTLAAE